MDLGNHQEVDGGLGVDVVKGHAFLIPIDDVGGDLPLHDLAEQAVGILGLEHGISLLYWLGTTAKNSSGPPLLLMREWACPLGQ